MVRRPGVQSLAPDSPSLLLSEHGCVETAGANSRGGAGRRAASRAGGATPTFRAGTKTVSLYATVTEGGRLVPGLYSEDFGILDDAKPQAVTVFSAEILPITVIVMLDTSGSMTSNIETLKAGAEQFFLRLFKGDRSRLGAFNDKIQWASSMSGNRDALIASLAQVDYGNGTRLYDALGASLEDLVGVEGRKVILVFTDGDDTASRMRFGTVLDRAQVDEVMVYAIGLAGEIIAYGRPTRTKPDSSLKKLAAETGGGYSSCREPTS